MYGIAIWMASEGVITLDSISGGGSRAADGAGREQAESRQLSERGRRSEPVRMSQPNGG